VRRKLHLYLEKKLEHQEGEEISVSNEVNQKSGAEELQNRLEKIDVEVVESDDGLWAVLSDKTQKQLTEDESEEQDYTKSDYEQALDGTVSEAQEAIEDFENPDYEKLIEL